MSPLKKLEEQTMKTIAKQAIVIGASMGGLLAARALADNTVQLTKNLNFCNAERLILTFNY
jgi:heterodisulfide reductase subunit A-like polyferredoxin